MEEIIKTINEKSTFEKIFKSFFNKSSAYIKSKSGNIEVKYLGYFDGFAHFQFPIPTTTPQICSIYTRVKNNIVIANLSLRKRKDENILLFNPIKFMIITSPRHGYRRPIDAESKKIIFITNILSDSLIQNSLARQDEKIKRISEMVKYEKKENFNFLKMYFNNQDIYDSRMEYFHKSLDPLFVKDFRVKDLKKHDEMLQYYLNNIYINDNDLLSKKDLVSEVSVPIIYDKIIPYGYIQVNGIYPFHASSLQVVQRMAVTAESMGKEYKLFSKDSHKFIVSDVSTHGLGIVFDNKDLMPFYKENNFVYMDIILPENRKASILADVRHVDIKVNETIKVGFLIKDMDSQSNENYNKFLNLISA